jgi:hypothetical protein
MPLEDADDSLGGAQDGFGIVHGQSSFASGLSQANREAIVSADLTLASTDIRRSRSTSSARERAAQALRRGRGEAVNPAPIRFDDGFLGMRRIWQ